MRQALEGSTRASSLACALLIVVLLAISWLPYAYGWLSSPAHLVFTGLMFDVPDHAQYWSWIAASHDALFISNTMTPEPNPPVFMNPTMWLLARAQAAFDLSFAALFQWWRVAALILLVPAVVAFVRIMVREPDRRPLALAIALSGSGLGWIWVVAKKLAGTADVAYPHDLYTVEPNTFWSMLSYPYLTLAHALILATMIGAWLAHKGAGWPAYVLGAVAAMALSLSHAYDLITIYAVLGLFGLVEWYRARRFPSRLAAAGAAIAACSGPAALYYQRLTAGDPLWQSVLSQYSNAGVWTPPPVHLAVLIGVPLLLAVCAAIPRDKWTDERRFLTIWAAAGLVLAYLPVVYQIKLLSAWQFPLALLAAHGWYERVVPALPGKLPRRYAVAVLVALVSLTNVYLFAWRFVELRRHAPPYYLHRDELEALNWLARNTRSSDVVIAAPAIGQFVPNHGRTRAYLAHWAMTNRYFERRANVERFFGPDGDAEWRQRLLRAEGVTLVLTNRWSSDPDATYEPARTQAFEEVFRRPQAQVYRFRDATVPSPPVSRR